MCVCVCVCVCGCDCVHVGVIVWLGVGVGVIAWARKRVCGWDRLDCCRKVLLCVCVQGARGGRESVCVDVTVMVWV